MSFTNLPIVNLLFKNGRTIEQISGFITLQENTKDELEITQQPVEQGATITDHAFSKPTVLTMQIQFDRTNTLAALAGAAGSFIGNQLAGVIGGAAGSVGGFLVAGAGQDVLAQTYQKLLDLQATREPFTIATPKRIYKNMLFQSLGVTTDKKTENVLSVSATFQQIIIVNTSVVTVPRANQQRPGKTGQTQNAGKKSALVVLSEAVQRLSGH